MYNTKNTYWFLLLIFSFLLVSNVVAQKENSFWVLDNNYALDFKDVQNPKIINDFFGNFWRDTIFDTKKSSINSICDKNGELLFYTDGNFVWNKNRQIMPNGTLAGHTNLNTPNEIEEQARAILIPNINNEFQYYIVVNDHIRQLNTYSIIDMRLNNGNGDVIVQKKLIQFTNGNYYGDFRATGVDSCKGIWLIGAAKNSYKQISAFKVGIDNISNSPIISNLNYDISKNLFKTSKSVLSESGNLIALNFYSDNRVCYIHKFNKNTGYFNYNPIYRVEPNNLSTTGILSSSFHTTNLFFADNDSTFFFCRGSDNGKKICVLSLNLFENNVYLIDSMTESFNRHPYCQIRPNKAYLSLVSYKSTGLSVPYQGTITSHNLAVINNPDGVGTNVGYDFNGITFPSDAFPRVPYQGLVNYYDKPKPRPRITLPTQQICTQTPFTLSADVSNLPQVQSGKQIWYLNDTEIISFNPNDSYTITEPGVYKLSFRHEECIEHTTITVTSPITANVPPKDTLCEGKALLLTTVGSVFVANEQNQRVNNPVSVAGVFTYTFAGCNTVSGSFELAQINKPALRMPVSVLGCVPQVVVLIPSFTTSIGQNFSWSNRFFGQSQSLTTSGLYVLTISNSCFAETDSTALYFESVPKITQPTTDTTVCEGQIITISATYPMLVTNELGNNTFATSLLGISKSGNYTINATNECFTTTSNLVLKTDAVPRFLIPTDTVICDYTTANIMAIGNKNNSTQVSWSDGIQENIRTISQAGEYQIEVKNTCGTFKKAFRITFAKSGAGFNGTNIFTPNGDEINDTWQPVTENVANYQVQVYNRYGVLVFETTTWNHAWNASASPDGLYFFHLSYTDCNQQTKNTKGWIQVMR